MFRQQRAQFGDVVRFRQVFQVGQAGVEADVEIAVRVIDIGDAAAHAGGEVAPGAADDGHDAAGHILAAVVAHAFHDGAGAAVADGEALAGASADEYVAAGGAVQGHVADDDVVLGHEAGAVRRDDDDAPAADAFAHIVVSIAGQADGHAGGQEGAEALPAGTLQADADGVRGQAVLAVAARHAAAEHCAHGAVGVADRHTDAHGAALFQRRARLFNELLVQGAFQAVVLCNAAVGWRPFGAGRDCQQAGEVNARRLPVFHRGPGFQQIHPSDHFGDGGEAQLGHNFPQFLGHEVEVVDQMPRLAGEAFAEFGVLGGDAHRAGVEVAFAQHNAAVDDEGGGGHAEFLGAEQGGDGDIPSGFELAVGLHHDAAAEVVGDQHLLGFGHAQFPGQAGVFDGRFRRSAGAAVVSADQHHIAMPFGDAGGNGANAHFGHQLDMDAGVGVDVFEVVDQLRQILNGIDVVVGRRRNKFHAGGSMAHPADVFVHLVAGQLAAFAGFGTLRHFDLQVGGVDQVVGRNAEAPGGDLFDGAGTVVAVVVGGIAVVILAALAGVAAGADAVHGDGHGFVGFAADGTQRNGAGGEPLDDFHRRFNLVKGNGLRAGLEFQQAAQGCHAAALVVDFAGELAIGGRVVGAGGVLQPGDGFGVPLVELAVAPPLVLAAHIQLLHPRHVGVVESGLVAV